MSASQTVCWRKPCRRLILWLGSLLLTSAGIVCALALIFPHRLLTVDDGEVKADALIVLGGETDERPARAAELFQAGAAPVVFVSGAGDYDLNASLLRAAGVPESAIIVEPHSISTFQNAIFTVRLLRLRGVHRAIIVTSWYHSRRALACFRHAAPDVQFYSRPAYLTWPRSTWSKPGISNYICLEYGKLLGYWIRYGVSPFQPPRS